MLNENQPPFPNENIQLEYKAQFTEKIKKEIAAFLNGRQTGYLYLGIDDQTRQIVHHFSKSEQHQIEETISHWLSGTTYYPSPVGLVTVHANETLFWLEIRPGTAQPYFLDQQVYVRNNSESVKASQERVTKMLMQQHLDTYELATAQQQNLHFEGTQAIFKREKLAFKPAALGFLNPAGGFTNTAFLMSDENEFIIKVAVFQGLDVMQFKDRKAFQGPLPEQIDQVLTFVHLNNPLATIITGKPQRDEQQSYPTTAIREALINAVVHRSYFSRSPIQVEIFDDRLTIMSPGPLPGGLQLKAVLNGQTMPRNPQIIKILHRLKYIEDYGTGIRRILSSYAGQTRQPEFMAAEDFVKVMLPNLNYQEGKIVAKKDDDFWNHQTKVIDYLKQHSAITRAQTETLLNMGRSQTSELLKRLTETQQIKKIGSGPAVRYTLVK